MQDDGLGFHAAGRLQACDIPDHVEVFEGGTAGLDLLDVVAHRRKVIIVDAIRAPHPPGTPLRLSLEELAPSPSAGLSVHHLGLLDVLAVARHQGCAPQEVVIIGAVPLEIDVGLELTPEVQAALPEVVKLVLDELEEMD